MKMTLSFIVLLFFVLTTQAQTFVSGSFGFEANYLPDAPTSSCLTYFSSTTGGYYYTGGNVLSVSMGSGVPLTILTQEMVQSPGNASPAFFDLMYTRGVGPAAECVSMRQEPDNIQGGYYHVDLTQNAKVVLVAKSDIPNTLLNVHLAYGANAFPERSTYVSDITKSISLSTTMTGYILDFSDWEYKDRVNMVGLYIGESNAKVTIEKISLGSQFWASYANHIKGNLFEDLNSDCLKQSGENGVKDLIVEASDGTNTYWASSDEDGNYDIAVDSGSINYAVRPHFNERTQLYVKNLCTPGRIVSSSGSGQDFCCSDFALKVTHCSLLSVDVNSDRRRRCFRNNTVVVYSNHGTSSSSAAVLKVVYPKYVKPISSDPAWTSQVDDTLFYDLGTIAQGYRGYIYLVDSVVCGNESIRGLSQCTKAIISPKTQCVSNEPVWDGSSVTVFPYCENGVARFIVQNVGLEDMTSTSQYRVYSNDTLVFQSTFQLISGNTFQVRYPANGAVIRLEADQRPSHPGRSQPRAFVEGCLASGALPPTISSESLVLSVPQDDLDEEVAISCMTILDSYDPNDKAAIPAGITDDHLVKAGTPLKYTIRFQNTGSDVAYKVVVVDTLDANLDMSTFTEIAASHAYVLKVNTELDKTVLTYTFNNINLKDSTTSEPESHGFLSFYINTKADLADGNTIHNKAEIYFDYNSAIITNTVDHTIGTYVPTDLTKGNNVQVTTGLFDGNVTSTVQRVTLYPNPASDVVQVKLDPQFNSGQLIILDLSGHEVWSGALKGEVTSVSLSTLSSGMYLYKVMSNGEYVGVGKLLVK